MIGVLACGHYLPISSHDAISPSSFRSASGRFYRSFSLINLVSRRPECLDDNVSPMMTNPSLTYMYVYYDARCTTVMEVTE